MRKLADKARLEADLARVAKAAPEASGLRRSLGRWFGR